MPAAIFGRSSAQSMCSPIPLSGAVILVMGSTLPPGAADRSAQLRSAARGPPCPEPGGRFLLAQGTLVEAQLHEEVQRLAHSTARPDAQDRHDLVAVEVG